VRELSIVTSGAHALLQPAVTLEFLSLSQLQDKSGVSTKLLVPADPGLAGIIVLFQWYVQSVADPSVIAHTDLHAARIWPAPAASMAAMSASQWLSHGTSGATERTIRDASDRRVGTLGGQGRNQT
jgi:hypothetical protein